MVLVVVCPKLVMGKNLSSAARGAIKQSTLPNIFLLDPAREKTTLAHPYLSISLSGALPESGQHTSGSLCPRLNPHTEERRWDTTEEGRGLTGRLSRDRSGSHLASPTHRPGPLSGEGVRQEGGGGGVVVVVVRGASCDVQKHFFWGSNVTFTCSPSAWLISKLWQLHVSKQSEHCLPVFFGSGCLAHFCCD